MQEEDYIMKILKRFFDIISLLINNIKQDKIEDIDIHLDEMFDVYIGKGSSFFYENDNKVINDFLSETKNPIVKSEMLAELLYAKAISIKERESGKNMLKKSLYMFEYLDDNSSIFSMDRMNKINEIKKSLTNF
ncbi:MAG: hypothetical protein HRT66_08655 [Flavobacteriaceae bacterium]|nr:hypothetical protein [Flavobacteriaceae bacterium]